MYFDNNTKITYQMLKMKNCSFFWKLCPYKQQVLKCGFTVYHRVASPVLWRAWELRSPLVQFWELNVFLFLLHIGFQQNFSRLYFSHFSFHSADNAIFSPCDKSWVQAGYCRLLKNVIWMAAYVAFIYCSALLVLNNICEAMWTIYFHISIQLCY